MALIYANAVNKRMNNPSSKPKKKNTAPCSFLDDSPTGTARDARKRSASRDAALPQRKASSNLPSHLQANNNNANSESASPRHRPVHRSKTSCGELTNRDDDEDAPRKTSHPAIYQSTPSQMPNSKRADEKEKRALAKKSLIQKYNLEHGYDDRLRLVEERRRSISLDPDQWLDQVPGQMDKQKKDGAFQKMKRKFSKWKMSTRPE